MERMEREVTCRWSDLRQERQEQEKERKRTASNTHEVAARPLL